MEKGWAVRLHIEPEEVEILKSAAKSVNMRPSRFVSAAIRLVLQRDLLLEVGKRQLESAEAGKIKSVGTPAVAQTSLARNVEGGSHPKGSVSESKLEPLGKRLRVSERMAEPEDRRVRFERLLEAIRYPGNFLESDVEKCQASCAWSFSESETRALEGAHTQRKKTYLEWKRQLRQQQEFVMHLEKKVFAASSKQEAPLRARLKRLLVKKSRELREYRKLIRLSERSKDAREYLLK